MGHIPRITRRFSIGRLTIALTLAVVLVAPGAAVARQIMTGSTKTAIVRTVPTALPTPQRCLVVYVTTKDGGNWATMGFNNAMQHSCIHWAANGVAIAHRVNGRWQYVASGSADIPCGRLDVPVAVRLDLGLPCDATASSPGGPRNQPIYFFVNVAAIIKAPSQPVQTEVIRPSTIYLFADGSWVLEKLHWTGWDTNVAHANGISSASNGNPTQAQGQRIKIPAQITLSHPGSFFGHTVYRCYQLTVPPPATDLRGCLTVHNGYWSILP